MQQPDTIQPDYGLDGDRYLIARELADVTPDPSDMITDMDLSEGDVFHDELEDVTHEVTAIGRHGDVGSILLDDPEATTDEERHESGISTDLASYYAKWRRGELTPME